MVPLCNGATLREPSSVSHRHIRSPLRSICPVRDIAVGMPSKQEGRLKGRRLSSISNREVYLGRVLSCGSLEQEHRGMINQRADDEDPISTFDPRLGPELLEYAVGVEDLGAPADVLDRLHTIVSQRCELNVLGAALYPVRWGDWSAI